MPCPYNLSHAIFFPGTYHDHTEEQFGLELLRVPQFGQSVESGHCLRSAVGVERTKSADQRRRAVVDVDVGDVLCPGDGLV